MTTTTYRIINLDHEGTLPGGVGVGHDRAIVLDDSRTERHPITGEEQPVAVFRGTLSGARAWVAAQGIAGVAVHCLHCGVFKATAHEAFSFSLRTLLAGFQCPRCGEECGAYIDGAYVSTEDRRWAPIRERGAKPEPFDESELPLRARKMWA